MKRVYIDDLVPGMKLAETVESASGKTLLEKGTVLKPPYIQRLVEIGIIEILVEDELEPEYREELVIEGRPPREEKAPIFRDYSAPPPAARLPRPDAEEKIPARGMESRDSAYHLNLSGDVFKLDFKDFRLKADPIKNFVVGFVDMIEKESRPGSFPAQTDISNYLPSHAMNVLFYSLLMAKYLGLDREKRIEIGLGAFLHDIGMREVTREFWDHDRKLTGRESAEIQKHPLVGRDLAAKNFRGLPPVVQQIIYTHHEREDGSGYRGLSGPLIPFHAKLISVADVFDAITSPRKYRMAGDGIYALQLLLGDNGAKFDKNMVQALGRAVSLFPLKSRVTLNDSTSWEVVAANRNYPFRPVLRSLDGQRELDLAAAPWLVVMDQVRYLEGRVEKGSDSIVLKSGIKFADDVIKKIPGSDPVANISSILSAFSDNGFGRLSLDHVDEKSHEFFFKGSNIFESQDTRDIMPVDFFAAGFLQEVLRKLFKCDIICFEYQCVAQGADCCRFFAVCSR